MLWSSDSSEVMGGVATAVRLWGGTTVDVVE